MDKGIIVAATHHIEWILPWWWYNYRAHNNLPVVFFDLGMTKEAQEWCKKRGELISLEVPDSLVFEKEKVDPFLAHKWEKAIGSKVWDARLKWFKKPFVFIKTPFLQTLWVDLDCEVRGPLDSLLTYSDNEAGLALAREPQPLQEAYQSLQFTQPGEITYNSGVVAYQQTAPFLAQWIEEVTLRNHHYISDQEALSRILFLEKSPFIELPAEYNWDRGFGPNPEALIFHWHGLPGKQMIKEQMNALSSLGFIDFSFVS